MKKQNAILHWLLYGGKKSNATTAALEKALNSIVPVPPSPVIAAPLAPAPIAPVVAGPALVAPVVTPPAPVAPVVPASAPAATPALVATPVMAASSVAPAVVVPAAGAPVPATITVDNIPVSTYSFVPQKPSVSLTFAAAPVDDPFEEFLVHMKSGKRPFRKPGMTVKEEFEAWNAHRIKTREAEAAKGQSKIPSQVRLQA
jgi:hypothetical protein